MAAQGVSNYVIEMAFDSDDLSSALAKANAWLTLQGKGVELQTVVGDWSQVSVYYTMVAEAPKPTVLAPASRSDTGTIGAVGPGSYTFTNGSAVA